MKAPAEGREGDRPVEEEVELKGEDLDTAYFRDHVLDLAEMLREQFYLALPMQPLCGPDCQGLCRRLPGINRTGDSRTSQCKTEWVNPKLSVLKALVTRRKPS